MNTFKRFSRILIVILFLALPFLFLSCEIEDDGTFKVEFFIDDALFETIELKKGYKIPLANETIAARMAEQGLYMKPRVWEEVNPDLQYNAQILEDYIKNNIEGYFWTVDGGDNDGVIWDFDAPVTRDMKLIASDIERPFQYNIAGKGKTFYDMAMRHVTTNVFTMGVYVLLLRDDLGEPDNEALGLYGREVNNVTFIPGAHLGIVGIGKERTIYGKGSGMFVLPRSVAWAGASLTLGNNITIKGRVSENGLAMIRVGDAATGPAGDAGGGRQVVFVMLPGSKVTGYTIRNDFGISNGGSVGGGAAVTVEGLSTSNNVLFHMKGGEITGNSNSWTGGGVGSGVTISNARMIMEGDAKITGNSGFGGDLAFGMSGGNNNFYLELNDNATIGEIFLFNNSTGSPNNNIRINSEWNGSINKLNLGWGGTGNFNFDSWLTNAVISSIGGGTLTDLIQNITLGDSFQWSNGELTSNGLGNYEINSSNGRLAAKP